MPESSTANSMVAQESVSAGERKRLELVGADWGAPAIGLLDELEARADSLTGVKVHQMHALRDRPYLHGAYRGHLNHVSWFLSHVTRKAYQAGGCEFAPANFSEVPLRLMEKNPVAVLAATTASGLSIAISVKTIGACALE